MVWLVLVLAVVWVLIIPMYIYLLFSKRLKPHEFVAVLLIASGGTMEMMGNSIIGNIGVGIFTIGVLMRIIDQIKRKK